MTGLGIAVVLCWLLLSNERTVAGERDAEEAQAAGEQAATQPVKQASQFARVGWNARVKQRFMHPPVVCYTPMEGAVGYRCTISWSDSAGSTVSRQLDSSDPQFDLAKVWADLPRMGSFTVVCEATAADGKVLAKASSDCQRMPSFKGPYRPAVRGYTQAGSKTVEWLLKYKPETGATTGSFPILFYSSYIRILTTYVRINPKGELAEQALALAKTYGEAMLKGTTPPDWVYANVPMSHGNPKLFQVCRGGMAGLAYLQLYLATKDKTWLDAAVRIADTMKKTQLPEGRWPFRVDPQTGKTLEDPTSDQVEVILLLDNLIVSHGCKEFVETRDKAVQWMLNNPCRTFQWQQQWEDVGVMGPYENQSWYDTALFTEYLLQHATAENGYKKLAGELARYIEDQFVEWESTDEWKPTGSYITPGVREQYCCYAVIDMHGAHYIRLCMDFHARTKDPTWLKKAQAMADTLTAVQHQEGFFPTYMIHNPTKEAPAELKDIRYGDVWANCTSYCGEMLMRLGEYVSTQGQTSPDAKQEKP